tara:strand:+ start:800 stop:1279 length:480 start_codon:yes stop_codon:yes gene_type:complete
MRLTVKRFADNGDTTLGIFYIDGIFKCFTIEDEEREEKVAGETRVPNGIYSVGLRTVGGFDSRYAKKYGAMHKGMLAIYNADNWKICQNGMEFQYVLIHTGNTDEHTAGCLLLNNGINASTFEGSSSVPAYKSFYPIIAKAIEKGEEVTIEYIDIEEGR